jgi:predicted SprT family Zn-dependent metalloprotease
VSLIPDNEHRLAKMKIEKNSAYACKECIQILMIAHNMAFATRGKLLLSRQCGRALSSVEIGLCNLTFNRR